MQQEGKNGKKSALYREGRDLSWRVLLENQVRALPLAVLPICQAAHIKVYSFQQAPTLTGLLRQQGMKDTDGGAVTYNGQYYILYDGEESRVRQRYTVAHELGHCLLGHLSEGTAQPITPDQERQAERFAIELLAPACVLWGKEVKTPEEIGAMCGISRQASVIRMERLQKLIKRDAQMKSNTGHGCFLRSKLERQVFAQFQPFLSSSSKSSCSSAFNRAAVSSDNSK